jgi:hypothetical protein
MYSEYQPIIACPPDPRRVFSLGRFEDTDLTGANLKNPDNAFPAFSPDESDVLCVRRNDGGSQRSRPEEILDRDVGRQQRETNRERG